MTEGYYAGLACSVLCIGLIGVVNSYKRQEKTEHILLAACRLPLLKVCFCVFRQYRAGYALQVNMYSVGEVLETLGQVGQA